MATNSRMASPGSAPGPADCLIRVRRAKPARSERACSPGSSARYALLSMTTSDLFGRVLDHVIDAGGERFDVRRIDRGEQADAQLVAA